MKYIYVIRNSVNGKVYIGQTKYKDTRYKQHMSTLNKQNHFNYKLQEDYNVFGEECFTYRILEVVQDNKCYERENYWINFYGGIDSTKVYNMQTSDRKNTDYRIRKSNAYTGNHPNPFKGLTHEEMYGKEKAEKMRKINSEKHKNKTPAYIPYKGKVKLMDGTLIEVTPILIKTIEDLRSQGCKYKDITAITGVKTNGIYNILHHKLKL